MISFTIITTTPTILRNQLIARDVIQSVVQDGQTVLVGVREGLEWIEVPNPIVTTVGTGSPDEPGTIMDTRRCYLVKLVRTAEANEVLSPGDLLHNTKLGQWVLANSTADTITSADGKSWPARKVGTNFWLVSSDDFGIWQ
jgi:hypothetical protein